MIPLFMAAKRVEDEHYWDPDPVVRNRNRDFEERLESVLPPYAPQQNMDITTVFSTLMKFGLLPGLAVWLIFLGVTEYRVVGNRSLAIIEAHTMESRQRMDELDRNLDRMVNLLRAQCVNAAKNGQERMDCLSAGR